MISNLEEIKLGRNRVSQSRVRMDRASLNKVTAEGLIEKVILEPRAEGDDRLSHVALRGKSISGTQNGKC
jgi:hypothetical protein